MDQTTAKESNSVTSRVWSFFSAHWRDYSSLLVFAGVIVTIDQMTKKWVRGNVPIWTDFLPATWDWLEPYARIRHVFNSGAAFGVFKNGGLIFTILAFIVSVVIIVYYPSTSRKDWWLRFALVLQLGGAVGNLVDRLFFGGVTDFISVGSFAIFNVADSCISVGVVVLLIGAWWMERKRKMAKEEEKSE